VRQRHAAKYCCPAAIAARSFRSTPSYSHLHGRVCYPEHGGDARSGDLAILSVPNRVAGTDRRRSHRPPARRALLIFASAELEERRPPERIASMARRAAKVADCGANCMGFFKCPHRCRLSRPYSALLRAGGITCIAQCRLADPGACCSMMNGFAFNLRSRAARNLVTSARIMTMPSISPIRA